MRIATWNVNSITARLPRLLAWLRDTGSDVVCLQETKVADAAFPGRELAELGYAAAVHGDGRWNGVAILSRAGIEDPAAGFPGAPSFPDPEQPPEAAGERPFVLAGDFNVAPSDEDVWDPAAFAGSTHVTPAERGAVRALLDSGLHDVPARALKHETPFTYWDYRAGAFHQNLGMRIDLVLANAAAYAEVADAYVDREARKGKGPSDHAPVVVDLSR